MRLFRLKLNLRQCLNNPWHPPHLKCNHRKEYQMSTSEYEQRTILVPQHKRIAMGEKLDGTSMQPKGASKSSKKPVGGLAQAKKK
jgi:hypothetical protein